MARLRSSLHDTTGALHSTQAALDSARTALRSALFGVSSVVPTRLQRLRNLKVFVLDNSIRESTVGQVC